MASTITIQDTMNWEKAFLETQPTEVMGMEPALSSAQLVLQTMLAPPFAWPWNRGTVAYTSGNQDNTVAGLNNFGYLEGGSVQNATNPLQSFAIQVKHFLEQDQSAGRPLYVGAFIDDGAGNITFRSMPQPDKTYNYVLPFQKKAPRIYSVGQTWTPVPDDLNHICQWGHLSLMSLIGYDARFNEYNQKFITALLATHGGLDELERNLFLSNWVRVVAQVTATNLGTQERYKAREV